MKNLSQVGVLNVMRRNKWHTVKDLHGLIPNIRVVSLTKNLRQMKKYHIVQAKYNKKLKCQQYIIRGL